MSHLSLDARAILDYLNELGYRNISAEQLKEFLKDLRKLIKYEDRLAVNKEKDYFENLYKRTTASYRAKVDKENKKQPRASQQNCAQYKPSGSTKSLSSTSSAEDGKENKNAAVPRRVATATASKKSRQKVQYWQPVEQNLKVSSGPSKCSSSSTSSSTVCDTNMKLTDTKSSEKISCIDLTTSSARLPLYPIQNNTPLSVAASSPCSRFETVCDDRRTKIHEKGQNNQKPTRHVGRKEAEQHVVWKNSCYNAEQAAKTRRKSPVTPSTTGRSSPSVNPNPCCCPSAPHSKMRTLFCCEMHKNHEQLNIPPHMAPWRSSTTENDMKNSCETNRSVGTLIAKMKTRPRKPLCRDPVALYHYYQDEWKYFKKQIPGADNNRQCLRWEVRSKLLDPDPS